MVKDKKQYNYAMVRIVCDGIITSCPFCNEKGFQEGYCAKCGRPLWKKPGERCGFILGYAENMTAKKKNVHIKCKYCNSVKTI